MKERLWRCYVLLVRRGAEMRHALTAFVFGTWLLLPFNTFGSSPTFREMVRMADESIWGILIVLIAYLHLRAIVGGGLLRRRLFGYVTASLWIFLAILSFLSNPTTTAVPVFSIIALAALWTPLHLINGRMP